MYVIVLEAPLPGVRATVFAFATEGEAEEFESCIHARYPEARTCSHVLGDPGEVFEGWSF